MSTTTKKVSDSATETLHIVRPNHLNAAGRLFGGVLMQWIDELAGLVAKRHSHMNVTTASVDNLRFLKGAYQRDVVVISGVDHVFPGFDGVCLGGDGLRVSAVNPVNRGAHVCSLDFSAVVQLVQRHGLAERPCKQGFTGVAQHKYSDSQKEHN